MIAWRVTYWLHPHPIVKTQIATLDGLALALKYDDEGKLSEVLHDVVVDDNASDADAIGTSQATLSPFFQALDFRYGTAIDVRAMSAARTDLPPPGGIQMRGFGTVKANALVVRPIVFPSETSLLAGPSRLKVWLYLANAARDATSDADAIRVYYMIIEDIYGRPSPGDPADRVELKHVRDFVSHGEKLGSTSLLAFLAREFGRNVSQYDPTDAEHVAFVNRWRTTARSLVMAELEGRLQSA